MTKKYLYKIAYRYDLNCLGKYVIFTYKSEQRAKNKIKALEKMSNKKLSGILGITEKQSEKTEFTIWKVKI
jgi:hypothetical protein